MMQAHGDRRDRTTGIRLLLTAALGLSACTGPVLTAGLQFGPGGVSVVPAVSGKVGGANVTMSP